MSDLQFLSFEFSNVFVPAETVILGCSLVVFWPELPKMSILFENLTSDDVQKMHQIWCSFYWSINKLSKLGQKTDFLAQFDRVFLLMASYTLWVTRQHFDKWITLLRYISVVSYVNIAFTVVKFKIFKVFRIDSAAMKWSLFGGFSALFPQILFGPAEIVTRGSLLERQNQCLKNPSKFWILDQMQCTQR